jgi:hypothetical protein
MRTAEEILEEYVTCNCDPAYKDRGLVAPDCPLCSMHSCYIEAMEAYAMEVVKHVTSKPMVEGLIDQQERTKYHPPMYMGIDEVLRHKDGTPITEQEIRICEYHYWIRKEQDAN